jgi:hypothetical protein
LTLKLPIDPFEEEFGQRFAVRQAMQLLGLTDDLEVAGLFLDGVQCRDFLQGLGGTGGFRHQRVKESGGGSAPASFRKISLGCVNVTPAVSLRPSVRFSSRALRSRRACQRDRVIALGLHSSITL